MAGLFFCLAPAEGAGLLFCPAAIQPHTSVYSAFCSVNAVIPPTPQNSAQGFTVDFPAICRVFPLLFGGCIRLYRIACATLERITAPQHIQRIPDTAATSGAVQGSTAAYYNNVYNGQRCASCYGSARWCSISQPMPARRRLDVSHARQLAIWHWVSLTLSIRRSSPAAEARRAARNHWRLSPHLFSGCRPIANKGEQ